jgi:hypothetical protein
MCVTCVCVCVCSLYTTMGMADMVASNTEAYVDLAVKVCVCVCVCVYLPVNGM